MGIANCFDAVSMVVEEATNQFAPIFKLDQEKYDILEQYCGVLDKLAEEFYGESFEVEVDEIKMTISIAMECGNVIVKDSRHGFVQLMSRASEVSFKSVNNDLIEVKFVFPSVWSRAM